MTWGFEAGRTYNRRKEIHARFGGQQQGGIITPADHPVIIIVTGDEGLHHGYADRYRDDGVFEYFGEGQQGDMQLVRGNAAIAYHAQAGKSLLLFKKTGAGLRFVAEMVCEGFHVEHAPDRNGNDREAIVFELRPLEAIAEAVGNMPPAKGSLGELRKRAFGAVAGSAQMPGTAKRTVYERSRDVRDYVLARANGHCEGCSAAAPFLRDDGAPYLEPHHTLRLSDGGPDHPRHVIALCPNCHRRAHSSADRVPFNASLIAWLSERESTGPV